MRARSSRAPLQRRFAPLLRQPGVLTVRPAYPAPLSDAALGGALAGFPVLPAKALIVVNDPYRATPTWRIVEMLRKLGKLNEPVTFAVATGTHKPPPLAVATNLSGATAGDELLLYDAGTERDFVAAGSTRRGTPVIVQRRVRDTECVLTVNSVEPHYFAGFTGGVKSLIPGLAHRETIERNHAWAMTAAARLMATTGNPVFEDLWEALERVRDPRRTLSIQLVNHGDSILHLSWGSLPDAFAVAARVAREIYGVAVAGPVQCVVSLVSPPLDRNLYQAHKAMENASEVLRDGATFVLVADCTEGIGTQAFFERMAMLGSPRGVLETLCLEDYAFGDHKAFRWAKMATRCELIYVGSLPSAVVRKSFMEKWSPARLEERVAMWLGRGDRVLVDAEGGYSAPLVESLHHPNGDS